MDLQVPLRKITSISKDFSYRSNTKWFEPNHASITVISKDFSYRSNTKWFEPNHASITVILLYSI